MNNRYLRECSSKKIVIIFVILAFVYFSPEIFSSVTMKPYSPDSIRPTVFGIVSELPTHREPPSTEAISLGSLVPNLQNRPRKFFLDCGANTGSTYKLFHEIWPNPEEYYMISFEIDSMLAPYYASFVNHTAMVPLGVSNEKGSFKAFLDPTWQPNTKR